MKSKYLRKILFVMLAFLITAVSLVSPFSISVLAADTVTVTSNGYLRIYKDIGSGDLGLFRYEDGDGTHLGADFSDYKKSPIVCGHDKFPAPMGNDIGAQSTMKIYEYNSNEKIRKILYYGYRGPEELKMFREGSLVSAYQKRWKGETGRNYFGKGLLSIAISHVFNDLENAELEKTWGYMEFCKAISNLQNPPKGFTVYRLENTDTSVKCQSLYTWQFNPAGNLKIKKSSSLSTITEDNGCYGSLSDAIFGVYTDKNGEELYNQIASINGNGGWTELDPGIYYIREDEAPRGYEPDDTIHKIEVAPGEEKILNFKNTPTYYTPSLLLKKMDENGKSGPGLEGARYIFKYYDDYFYAQDEINENRLKRTWVMKTDKNGEILLQDSYKESGDDLYYDEDGKPVLPRGTLTIKEIGAPDGFEIDKTLHIMQYGNSVKRGNAAISVEPFKKGQIIIKKTANQLTRVEKSTTTIAGKKYTLTTPIYEEEILGGAVFNIYADEDIKSPNGELIYAKDSLVQALTTNGQEPIKSDKLVLGKYYVVEISTIAGYKLDGTRRNVTITADAMGNVINPELLFKNERTKTQIKFNKKIEVPYYNEENGLTKITLKRENGEGFTFGLFLDEENLEIQKDSLVAVGITDENGEICFDQPVPFGKYYVKELARPMDAIFPWVISDDSFPVDLSTDKTDGTPIVINPFENLETGKLTNEMTPFSLSKNDIVTGKPVEGAVVCIKDTEGKIVFTGITNNRGIIEDIYLPIGDYVFFEKCPPKGYLKNENEFFFSVDGEGVVSGVTGFTNEPIPELKTRAMFHDKTKNSIPHKNIKVIDVVSCKNLVVGKEYTLKGTLVDRDNPKRIIASGERSFVAGKHNDNVQVIFMFDGAGLEGTCGVIFEELYINDRKVSDHTDLTDEDQTLRFPEIATEVSKGHIGPKKNASIVDTIAFKSLTPGVEYVAKGILMDKQTGTPIIVNGKTITAQKKFVPKEENGTVKVNFNFDADTLDKRKIVVFEEIYEVNANLLVGEHKDINDKKQTVSVISEPLTGDRSNTLPYAALAIVSGTICLAFGLYRLMIYRRQ